MTQQMKFCITGYFPEEELTLIPFLKQNGFHTLSISSSIEDGPIITCLKDKPNISSKKDFEQIATNLVVSIFKNPSKPRYIYIDFSPSSTDTYMVYKRSKYLDMIYD